MFAAALVGSDPERSLFPPEDLSPTIEVCQFVFVAVCNAQCDTKLISVIFCALRQKVCCQYPTSKEKYRKVVKIAAPRFQCSLGLLASSCSNCR